MRRDVRHIPVLLDAVVETLKPRDGKIIVDCTLGLGGHASEILQRIKTTGQLIGIDFDPSNVALAQSRLQKIGGHYQLFQNNFAALPEVLIEAKVDRVDGVLADLGVASPQIDNPARGFSYRHPGPLDMRMDPTRGQTAATLVNRLSESQLAIALTEFGDETDAPAIAHLIVQRRVVKAIQTTQELTAIVCEARDFTLQRAAGAKLHPAARTFQALRILVNRELANLERLLNVLPTSLAPGGIAAIISFHSGEDRRVKAAFREGLQSGVYSDISADCIVANENERDENPRARSAKLRYAVRAPARAQ